MIVHLLLACAGGPMALDSGALSMPPTVQPPPPLSGPPNVLILLVDDLGLDKVGAWGAHPTPPPTPNIDALVAGGLRFDNAYTTPSCSPTRAALQTGRHGRRTGIGRVIRIAEDAEGLPLSEVVLPEMLEGAPDDWETLFIGKWHLGVMADPELETHPNRHGWDAYTGSLDNPTAIHVPLDDPSYENWLKTTDGVTTPTDTYATTDSVNEALARIPALGEPWLTVLAFNAIHSPYHKPPAALTPTLPADPGRPDRPKAARAMAEALDTEVGRLLSGLDADLLDRTVIIFLSDNGTSKEVIEPPWDPTRAKLTLYDGGCRVPMAISGPVVRTPGATTRALVHVVDLFPTVAELAGVALDTVTDDAGDVVQLDGLSLVPVLTDPTTAVHETIFVERFMDNGAPPARALDNRMIRSERYKYMESFNGERFFFEYDPTRPWTEGENLIPAGLTPEQQRARERLEEALDAQVAEMEAEW